MPPSRRKACVACTQTKRKCDRAYPSCQRCLAVKRECAYVGRSQFPGHSQSSAGFDEVGNVTSVEPTSSDWLLQQSPRGGASGAMLSPTIDNLIFDFPNHPFNFPSVPNVENYSSGIMADISSTQDVATLQSTSPNLGVQSRVDHAAQRLRAIPATFASQAQTSFIHRMLFQHTYPAALQDALSTCALYTLKSPHTKSLVFHDIASKRDRLIGGTNPLSASKHELLAAVQALLLYQIIRFFDGDIRLRAQAEADESTFIAWTGHLSLRIRQIQPCRLSPMQSHILPPSINSQWYPWLIEESGRRTLIVSYMLKGVYDFLKTGMDHRPDMQISFTAQAALWRAQSETSWRRALAEKERLEIRVTNWDHAIARAEPNDLEELGILIMAMLWGLDATETWVGPNHEGSYGMTVAG